MGMRNRIAALVTAVTIGLGGAVAVSSPAQAAWDDCPSHGLCLYSGSFGAGTWYFAVVEGLSNNTCVTLPAHRNNWARSSWNRAHYYTVKLYTGDTCNGFLIAEMDQGVYWIYFADEHVKQASSYRVLEYA